MEITHFDDTSEDRLFVGRSCRYKHKYHSNCMVESLTKACNGDIKSLVEGLEDYKKPQPVCCGYGCALNIKDLKKLFPDYFREEYLTKMSAFFSDNKFVLNKKECPYNKENKRSIIKACVMVNTPFKRKAKRGEKLFAMGPCPTCPKAKAHLCEWDRIKELLGDFSNMSYCQFCCQCGVTRGEAKSVLRLSCRHTCCDTCGIPWLSFANLKSKAFQAYLKDNVGKVQWPVISCYFCGKMADLVSIQLHDNHYISLQQILRMCFLNNGNLDKCIEAGCSCAVGPQMKDILRMMHFDITRIELSVDSLLSYEEIKVENVPRELHQWLRHRYAKILAKDQGFYLVGYKNMFEEAKDEATTKAKECIELVRKFEKDYSNFVTEAAKNIAVDVAIKEIEGVKIKENKPFDKAKERYVDACIFAHMYGYQMDTHMLFMNVEGMDMKKFGENPDKDMCVAGPYGRGFYLSPSPKAIHGSSRAKENVFNMAVACIARSKDAKKERRVVANDIRRVAGDIQKANIGSEEEEKEVPKESCGRMNGNVLDVEQDSVKWTVVYDPVLVVPLHLVSYNVEFT